MPAQLDLLDHDTSGTRSIWSRLSAPARQEVVDLFAALLVAAVRPQPSTEEAASESLEDRVVAPRP